jgi:hypothetical protein
VHFFVSQSRIKTQFAGNVFGIETSYQFKVKDNHVADVVAVIVSVGYESARQLYIIQL